MKNLTAGGGGITTNCCCCCLSVNLLVLGIYVYRKMRSEEEEQRNVRLYSVVNDEREKRERTCLSFE